MPPKRQFSLTRKTRKRSLELEREMKQIPTDMDLEGTETKKTKPSPTKERSRVYKEKCSPEKKKELLDNKRKATSAKRLQMGNVQISALRRASQQRKKKSRNSPRSSHIGRRNDDLFEGTVTVTEHNVGRIYDPITGEADDRFSKICDFCSAILWKDELSSKCCKHGDIDLPPLWPRNDENLKFFNHLFTKGTKLATTFRKFIVIINNALSLASLSVKRVDPPGGGYKPSVVIQGKVGIKMGPLQPTQGPDVTPPAFAQLYVLDPVYQGKETEIRFRNIFLPKSTTEADKKEIQELLERLDKELHAVNEYIKDCCTATEIIKADDPEPATLIIDANKRPDGAHSRQYNREYKEFSVLLHDEDPGNQDIVIRLRGPGNHAVNIDDTHRSVDALRFVVLFPDGADGWHTQLKRNVKSDSYQKCTARMFYRYHLQTRGPFRKKGTFSTLHRAGRLFQEYVCLSFAKIQHQELRFLEQNQKELRAEKYSVAIDQFRAEDADISKIGQLLILPPSHVGSPRYMHKNYQNGVAIFREFHKPDLFITMTANPRWPEIIESLLPGQEPRDRPDLVARVFKLKIEEFFKDLKEKQIFGKLAANMYVVEFQKRGLPHIHYLLILQEADRIRTPEEVDQITWAELIDPLDYPEGPLRILAEILLKLVINHMYHSCSPICLDNGKCKRFFPKPYCEETKWNEEAMYPEYRRRPGREVRIGNKTYTNQYVVPYNPFLLLKYQCHLNVECTISMKSIKYLYLYINKGSDRIMVSPQERRNEILSFENCRSIGSSEACWRIFEYKIGAQYPNVYALRVHLENEQNIFVDNQSLRSGPPITELIGFFNYNAENPDTRVKYVDFPKLYCWKPNLRQWESRKNDCRTIGRIQVVHPTAGESFYLRILLHHEHSKGKTSFRHMKELDGVQYSSYKEVCGLLGLLQDDGEWQFALHEASHTDRSERIRALFDVILRFCDPVSPNTLFNDNVHNMWDDFERRFPDAGSDTYRTFVLIELEKKIQPFGKQLVDFGLPDPSDQQRKSIETLLTSEQTRKQSIAIQEQLDFDLEESTRSCRVREAMLNDDQKAIYEEVMHCVTQDLDDRAVLKTLDHFCVFIDARGGTGKTFLLNTILLASRTLGDRKNIALAVASSGIAATLLLLGRTFHSRFKAPIHFLGKKLTFRLKHNTEDAKVILEAKLIIWDEAPMAHKLLMEGLDVSLRDLTGVDKPFGGKVLILAGDFRQVLPVVRHGSPAQIVEAALNRSSLFPLFQIRQLSKNLRLTADRESGLFDDFLLKLGNGSLPIVEEPDWVSVPPKNLFVLDDSPAVEIQYLSRLHSQLSDFVDIIFPNLLQRYLQFRDSAFNATAIDLWVSWLADRAILAPKNCEVDAINQHIIDTFPDEERIALSADMCLRSEDAFNYPVELLNETNPSGIPPHKLFLKKGIILLLLRNLNPKDSLCNGTRLILKEFTLYLLHCIIASGKRKGDTVLIPRIDLKVDDTVLPLEWKRRQFPVRPAFAMTINKSQGQTLQKVGVWLREPCFTHGQLYVASSRVRNQNQLHFAVNASDNRLMKNVVFHDALIAKSYRPPQHHQENRVFMRLTCHSDDIMEEINPTELPSTNPDVPESYYEDNVQEAQSLRFENSMVPSINTNSQPLNEIATIWDIPLLEMQKRLSLIPDFVHTTPHSCALDSILDLLHYTFMRKVRPAVSRICPNNGDDIDCHCSFCSTQSPFFVRLLDYSIARSQLWNQKDLLWLNNDIWDHLADLLPNDFLPKGKGTASNQGVTRLLLSPSPEDNSLWGVHRLTQICECGWHGTDVQLPLELIGTGAADNFEVLVIESAFSDAQCSQCGKLVEIDSPSFKDNLIFNLALSQTEEEEIAVLPDELELCGETFALTGFIKNIGNDQEFGLNHFVAIVKDNENIILLDDLRADPTIFEDMTTCLSTASPDNHPLSRITSIVYQKQ